MPYSIIAAVSENNAIGNNNKIPWHLPQDLKLFKSLTLGGIIIMGRLTYESIGKPLPGRTTIVISSDPAGFMKDKSSAQLHCTSSLKEALKLAGEFKLANEAGIFVAGGASVYKQAMDEAERLYISRIPGIYKADTFFPEIDQHWQLESQTDYDGFNLETYTKRS